MSNFEPFNKDMEQPLFHADQIQPAFKILTQNFKMDDELKAMISLKVESLIDLAPNDSEIVVKLIKEQTQYKGHLLISTLNHSFESDGQNHNAYELVKYLCRQVREQMHNWKKGRFEPGPPLNMIQ